MVCDPMATWDEGRRMETGTLIWTILIVNFWLPWKKQRIPFFYQEKPSDLSAALRWRKDGSKGLHCVSSLQSNVTLIAKESMWWGKVQAVWAVPGAIFGPSALRRGTPSAAPAGEISLWQIMQRQPASLLGLISCEQKCPFAYREAFAYSSHAMKVTLVSACLAI